jgi:hypothetical protein
VGDRSTGNRRAGCGAGLLVLISQPGSGLDEHDPELESTNWRRADAEVISVLRAGHRTFLMVRFTVGTSLIRNDVRYPLAGAVPHAGQRVPIRYDPVAPARVDFDLHPESSTSLKVARSNRSVTNSQIQASY